MNTIVISTINHRVQPLVTSPFALMKTPEKPLSCLVENWQVRCSSGCHIDEIWEMNGDFIH
jgi:hypothetical protein